MSPSRTPFTPAIVVRNLRPRIDWNTCGQAAVATVLRAHGLAMPGTDAEDIDRVRSHHPPDLPFGLGTSARRIAAALAAHGLEVEVVHSGWFGRRLPRARARLVAHLERALPAIVCLDGWSVNAGRWSAHWAVALWMDEEGVRLGNVPGDGLWAWERFERAWACRHLPYGHNHAAILARRPDAGAANRSHRADDRSADDRQLPRDPPVSSLPC